MAQKSAVTACRWAHSFGARNMLTKKLVNTLEDLAGMRVRSLLSPPVIETVRAMGALPTPIPINEAYISLHTAWSTASSTIPRPSWRASSTRPPSSSA